MPNEHDDEKGPSFTVDLKPFGDFETGTAELARLDKWHREVHRRLAAYLKILAPVEE